MTSRRWPWALAAAGALLGVSCGAAPAAGQAEHAPAPISAEGTFVTSVPLAQTAVDYGVDPATLVIPRIHVVAAVEHVGETADRTMESPRRPEDVAWYSLGFRPGEKGHAVIAGHLDTADPRHPAAVFANLGQLTKGDAMSVTGEGRTINFVVTGVASYPGNQLPLTELFGAGDSRTLELITCAGTYGGPRIGYSRRLVVTAVEQPA